MRSQMIRIRVDGAWLTLRDEELYLRKERNKAYKMWVAGENRLRNQLNRIHNTIKEINSAVLFTIGNSF